MVMSLTDLDDRIAVVRESIQQLLEKEPVNEDDELRILEQLTQRNAELEELAARRDALEQAEQAAGVANKQN